MKKSLNLFLFICAVFLVSCASTSRNFVNITPKEYEQKLKQPAHYLHWVEYEVCDGVVILKEYGSKGMTSVFGVIGGYKIPLDKVPQELWDARPMPRPAQAPDLKWKK